MKAFITGSQVYGTPRSDSDVDLVVLVSKSDSDILKCLSDNPGFSKTVYGNLNLIVLNTENPDDVIKYSIWERGTRELIAKSPVTRQEAINLFDTLGLLKGTY